MKKINLLYFFILIAVGYGPMSAFSMTKHIRGPNRAPNARAGFDQKVEVYHQVMLDGSESFDPDGEKLFYTWRLKSAPAGSKARSLIGKSMKSCFVPDKEGTWIVGLTVTDGRKSSIIDVMRVTARSPEKLNLPGPPPDRPDFKVMEFIPMGLSGNRVGAFHIEIVNLGSDYSGPLEFRIIGMDQLVNGHFSMDKRISIDALEMRRGEKKWLTLLPNEVEWPERIRKVTFRVLVDPGKKIPETKENNNFFETTRHRFKVSSCCCGVVSSDTIRINGSRGVRKGQRFSFPYKKNGTSIGLNLINCGKEAETFKLIFIYDWSPVKSGGENILIKSYQVTLAPDRERYLMFTGLRIPRKKKYKKNYTTFAILRSHENGYDVLYETPVTADYVKIVGK